ncbi:MAG: F0F1 ATP synthase subunit A [Proteobacteria bacterium]|nr:F0F1 ATP synthase subunit A [Pseudomonadota bacterium]
MPHGQSWFSFLPFDRELEALVRLMPFSADGKTWLMGEPVSVAHVYGAVLIVLLLAVLALATSRSLKAAGPDRLVPEDRLTLRTFAELFVGTIYRFMADSMGPRAARHFLPLIGTCAFFIFFSNSLGLIPGFLPPTNKLDTTLACALVIFCVTHVYGVKHHGLSYFKHFLGPIVKWRAAPLIVLMLFLETVSHLVRPLSLSVRLAANMDADHRVLDQFGELAPFLIPIPMLLLGALVVTVQTLVFCLLSTVYIAMAIEQGDH